MDLILDERNRYPSRQTLVVLDSPQLELTHHELFICPPDTPAVGSAVPVEVAATPGTPAFIALTRTIPLTRGQDENQWYEVFFRDSERPLQDLFSTTTRHWNWLSREPNLLSDEAKTRWFHPPHSQICLALKDNGYGEIQWSRSERYVLEQFEWGRDYTTTNFWWWSADEFAVLCDTMIADPASAFNYCKNWHVLSPEEKTALVLRCKVGNWDEVLRLFSCVLQLLVHHFGGFPYLDYPENSWNFIQPSIVSYIEGTESFARLWRETLFSIIRPEFWIHPTAFTQKWVRQQTTHQQEVSCTSSSAHDAMEAQLELREFLRPYLSETEIVALLTP